MNLEGEELLLSLTRQLTEAERPLFQLFFIEGKTALEVAEILGLGPATVRSRKQRLVLKLRMAAPARLRPRGWAPGPDGGRANR